MNVLGPELRYRNESRWKSCGELSIYELRVEALVVIRATAKPVGAAHRRCSLKFGLLQKPVALQQDSLSSLLRLL